MRVARAFGQDPMAVAARSFAATAWAFLTLSETEEFDDLKADAAALQGASRFAIAFHEPKRLEGERLSLLARLRESSATSVQSALERGRRLVERIRKGRVLDDVTSAEATDGH